MKKLIFTKPNAYSGIFIKDCDATGIVIAAAGISWVDIHHAPNLRSITFETSDELHLSTSQCPLLRHISLPRASSGAVVHLDLGADALSLAITGLIKSIDTCSAFYQPTMASLAGQVFDGALVLHKLDTPHSYSGLERRELVVVQGLKPVKSTELFAKLFKLKGLVVTESAIDQIVLPHGHVEFMRLSGLERLQEITLGSQTYLAEFDGCDLLSIIRGSGRLLRVRNSQVADLSVKGFWDRGQFDNVQAELHAPGVATAIGRGCRHILPTYLDVSNATNPLAILPCPEAIYDAHWQALLLNWVNVTELRSSALAGVVILKGLLEAGTNADTVKQSRRKLLCNLTNKKAPRWEWPQTDLEMEIYLADLELLYGLLKVGAVHPDELETLLQINTLAQVIAILRIVRKRAAPELDEKLATIILTFLKTITTSSGKHRTLSKPLIQSRELSFLQSFLESLIAVREHQRFTPLFAVLPVFVLRLFGDEAALPGIASLSLYGLQSARRLLVQNGHQLRKRKHKLAPRYFTAAMAPPKSALLSGV